MYKRQVLINWKATHEEMVKFLNQRLDQQEQNEFMDKIHALKQEIGNRGLSKEIYCSKEISNNDCLKGYKNLAKVKTPKRTKRTGWHEIMITHSSSSSDKPNKLILGFNDLPAEMESRILKDPYETFHFVRSKNDWLLRITINYYSRGARTWNLSLIHI